MKILVINAGSSSMKFTLFSMDNEDVLAKGVVERLGTESPNMIYKQSDGYSFRGAVEVANHVDAIKAICKKIADPQTGIIRDLSEINAFGHRVVHGGESATRPVLVNAQVKEIIRACFPLAPLHNPANLSGIDACEINFPGTPNVAVFDTAFHQLMPPEAYMYALPYELYREHGIRRYGFHGTSHNFVAVTASKILGRPLEEMKMITCHLGNGCSMAAIENGIVIDTTMGMTPLEGLMMGTRCGDIDPAVVLYLLKTGKKPDEIDHLLNKESGLLGIGGIHSFDMRDIIAAGESGNKQAVLAHRMFTRRVIKYIGAYYALLNGTDALIFTGGIGEWSAFTREQILENLTGLGILLDNEANKATLGSAGRITLPQSKCKVLVVPTDEELMIARSVMEIINSR